MGIEVQVPRVAASFEQRPGVGFGWRNRDVVEMNIARVPDPEAKGRQRILKLVSVRVPPNARSNILRLFVNAPTHGEVHVTDDNVFHQTVLDTRDKRSLLAVIPPRDILRS